MKKALPIVLAFAASTFPVPETFAVGPGHFPVHIQQGSQAPSTDAESAEAFKLWNAETDPAKKHQLSIDIVSKYFASKSAEYIAYNVLFKNQVAKERKDVALAYLQGSNTSGQTGSYLEYAVRELAVGEADIAKAGEYAKLYSSKFPSGKFNAEIRGNMERLLFNSFQEAIKAKNLTAAVGRFAEAQAGGFSEWPYVYSLSYYSLADLSEKGKDSTVLAQSGGWADRGITFIESGKLPDGAKPEEWVKSKPDLLLMFHRTRALTDFFSTVKRQPTNADDFNQSIASLKKVTELVPRDAQVYYLLSIAYNSQYEIHQKTYAAIPEADQGGEAGLAALAKVNAAADLVIEAYLRVMAFAGQNEALKKAVEPGLIGLWQYRHEANPDGWKTEVERLATEK